MPGKGSEFAVKLPALEGAAGHEMTTTLEPGERAGQPLRVLVVEDNIDAGDSLSMLLRLHGHEVLVARTGPTALEVAASFHPALVLLDIGLPGMDGYEVARRLRADPALTGMTLCALTGYTPSEADRLPTAAGGVRPPLRQADRPGRASRAAENPRLSNGSVCRCSRRADRLGKMVRTPHPPCAAEPHR